MPIGSATPEVIEETRVEVTNCVEVPGKTLMEVKKTGVVMVLVIVLVTDVKVE
jgi:hypothetical protein